MLRDNTLDPSPLPFIGVLTGDSREDVQENEESQKALDEVGFPFEEKEQTSQANEEFSEKPAVGDELKGKEESKDQNIDRGIIDTLNAIESTLEEIGQVFEINEKTQSHIDSPDEFKGKEEVKSQTTDSDIIGTLNAIESTFQEIERALEINEKIQPDAAALANELENKKEPTERATIENSIPPISNLVKKAERAKEQLGQSF